MTRIEFTFKVGARDESGVFEEVEMRSRPNGTANISRTGDEVSAFHLLAKSLDAAREFLERVAPICNDCEKKATHCECLEVAKH